MKEESLISLLCEPCILTSIQKYAMCDHQYHESNESNSSSKKMKYFKRSDLRYMKNMYQESQPYK